MTISVKKEEVDLQKKCLEDHTTAIITQDSERRHPNARPQRVAQDANFKN